MRLLLQLLLKLPIRSEVNARKRRKKEKYLLRFYSYSYIHALKPNLRINDLHLSNCSWVLEVSHDNLDAVFTALSPCSDVIGRTTEWGASARILVKGIKGETILDVPTVELLSVWEDTSFHLEMRQANEECVREEFLSWKQRGRCTWSVGFKEMALPRPGKSSTFGKFTLLIFLSDKMTVVISRLVNPTTVVMI